MIRKFRLIKIKKFRAIRDELIKCDNEGRAEYLLMKFPNVRSWHNGWLNEYQIAKFITIQMVGGYKYSFTGHGPWIESFKAAGLFAYNKWIEKYLD